MSIFLNDLKKLRTEAEEALVVETEKNKPKYEELINKLNNGAVFMAEYIKNYLIYEAKIANGINPKISFYNNKDILDLTTIINKHVVNQEQVDDITKLIPFVARVDKTPTSDIISKTEKDQRQASYYILFSVNYLEDLLEVQGLTFNRIKYDYEIEIIAPIYSEDTDFPPEFKIRSKKIQ